VYASVEKKSTALCDLTLYSQYLLVSPQNRGCSKLSKAMESMSHDSVLNFLVREDYTPFDLFSHSTSLIELQGGTLSVDDSVWDKPYSNAKLNPLIGHHYSGKHHKVVQGICLVTLFYTDVKGVRVPVNYRIYLQAEDKTKNDLFREMLNEVLDWGLSPKLVAGDSWYASVDNLKWIRRKQIDAFFAVESDRQISTQKGIYLQVQQADIGQQGLWTHLKGFDFVTLFSKEEQGKVRHYLYYKYAQKEQQQEKQMKATYTEFEKAHCAHWHIECFHRAIKQLCNAEHFLVRRSCAVKTHIFSVYWAFITLEEKVVNKLINNWYEFREKIHQHFIKVNLT